jgi:hypothetical protein
MFRALLAHPQEVSHKRHLVYCVRVMSVGCARIGVELESKTRMERDIINVRGSSCKVSLFSCLILKKLEFSRQVFTKYSNIKFHEYPCSGSRAIPCGRTDGQT